MVVATVLHKTCMVMGVIMMVVMAWPPSMLVMVLVVAQPQEWSWS